MCWSKYEEDLLREEEARRKEEELRRLETELEKRTEQVLAEQREQERQPVAS